MLNKSLSGSREQGTWSKRFFAARYCISSFQLLVLLAISLLLFPTLCRAKEIPPGRWWHIPYFSDQLEITDQQRDELDKLFDYNRNRLAELKKQMEEERNELVQSVDQEHLNETSVVAKMKKLESTRTLLAATHFSYSLEVRKLLGYERFQRLKTLYRNWPGLQPQQQ